MLDRTKALEALKQSMRDLGTILAWEELDGEILVVHTWDLDRQNAWFELANQMALEREE